MALAATAAATVWRFEDQREKERDLLFAGRQISQGIENYRAAHATRAQPYPLELTDLLGEKVGFNVVRYLRRVYVDPMTGTSEWGVVRNPTGGIVAVYSLSTLKPIRLRPIAPDETSFPPSETYATWKFFAKDGRTRPNGGIPLAGDPGKTAGTGIAAIQPPFSGAVSATAPSQGATSVTGVGTAPATAPGSANGIYSDAEGAPPPKPNPIPVGDP